MISPRDLTAVILAGGKAQKQGGIIPSTQDVDGRKVLERQAAVLKPKVSRIEVSVSVAVAWSRFPSIVDQFGSVGPLSGIATALSSASTDYVLIVGGAFAWIQPEVLDLLVARSGEPFDATAFRFNYTDPNPLLAIYHKRCAPRAIARLERGDHDAMGLLTSESLAVRWIEDYELQSFDPEMVTFKEIQGVGSGAAPAKDELAISPTPASSAPPATITVPVAFDPGESTFAFQGKPAYQSALKVVSIAFALAKLGDAEVGGQLARTALALTVAIAEGAPARSSAFACGALLDVMRALGVVDPRIAEAQSLLAAIVQQPD